MSSFSLSSSSLRFNPLGSCWRSWWREGGCWSCSMMMAEAWPELCILNYVLDRSGWRVESCWFIGLLFLGKESMTEVRNAVQLWVTPVFSRWLFIWKMGQSVEIPIIFEIAKSPVFSRWLFIWRMWQSVEIPTVALGKCRQIYTVQLHLIREPNKNQAFLELLHVPILLTSLSKKKALKWQNLYSMHLNC